MGTLQIKQIPRGVPQLQRQDRYAVRAHFHAIMLRAAHVPKHRFAVPNVDRDFGQDIARASVTNGVGGSNPWGVDEIRVCSAEVHEAARFVRITVAPLRKRKQRVGRIGHGLLVAVEEQLPDNWIPGYGVVAEIR